MSRFGKGWIRSTIPLRRNFAAHPAMTSAVPLRPHVDHGPAACPIFDQGDVGSCWANATPRGIVISLNLAGTPLGFIPSQDNLYRVARCLMRAAGETSGPLSDTGTDPFYGMQAVAQWGVKPMGPRVQGRNSDCALANVADEPLFGDLEEDARSLIVGAYQITSTGKARCDAIRTALNADLAVTIGVDADAALENWSAGDAPLGAPDQANLLGGHMLEIDGYDLAAKTFVVANSWSEGYGDAGRFIASEAWIEAPGAGDIYAFAVSVKEAA